MTNFENEKFEELKNFNFSPDLYETTFTNTKETENYQPDKTTDREWEAIREECVSGGALDERCNIVAAAKGTGRLEVVQKKLVCGCILVPSDVDEIVL